MNTRRQLELLDLHPEIENVTLEVCEGLKKQQKSLSPKYFYDERGSELFEAITQLYEYYPTRTELALFDAYFDLSLLSLVFAVVSIDSFWSATTSPFWIAYFIVASIFLVAGIFVMYKNLNKVRLYRSSFPVWTPLPARKSKVRNIFKIQPVQIPDFFLPGRRTFQKFKNNKV